MQTITIIYILLALLFSIAISWFLYFYRNKNQQKINYFLFCLRFVSVFLLLLLLINPLIERREITNKKPVLSVLVDNSLSIQYFKREKEINSLFNKLKTNKALNDKFRVDFFQFGENINALDSLNFKSFQTNIYSSIRSVDNLNKDKKHPIVLLSDGNQTNGSAYQFIETNKNVFPVVIGDTITKSDVSIAQLNVNKYSYLRNKFPVEARILFDGNKKETSQFKIQHKGKTIYKKNISFPAGVSSQTITTTINSEKDGIQYYTASLSKIKGEKNVKNNTKTFSVEVLNEQTKVLLLTSFLHPDVGMFKKAIETNKQRAVDIHKVNDFKGKLADYQLVILYQPIISFSPIFEKIKKQLRNYFVVTGPKTNWNFLNEVQQNYYKNSINQSEDYGAIFNNGFLTFGQKDIAFNEFPPLKDAFGRITVNTKFDALLYQNISGIKTETPLLATFENNNHKSAVLFGEGIWKWRATSFINSNSFEDFDAFISNLIQYLATTKRRQRLTLNYEKLFSANEPISISAFYVDKNYQFDKRANLSLKLVNIETNQSQNVPFSLQRNSFEVVLDNLPSGDYEFTVSVENQSIKELGKFKITAYKIEEQFTKANTNELGLLAENTNGKLYFETQANELITNLIENQNYKTVQSSKLIKQQLIDWKLLLVLAILFLSIEWFTRKYLGKI